MELKASEFGVVLSVDALKLSRQSPLGVGIGGGGGGGSCGGQGGGCGGCSNGCSGVRIPLYSITDWHRSPISDSHPFDQPGT
ncbi:microcin B17 family TOMM [Escherichia coli]|nr:microcin B17 family TOMM [Escherichia coli]